MGFCFEHIHGVNFGLGSSSAPFSGVSMIRWHDWLSYIRPSPGASPARFGSKGFLESEFGLSPGAAPIIVVPVDSFFEEGRPLLSPRSSGL